MTGRSSRQVLALLLAFGALGQLWLLVQHARRGEFWGSDALVAAMCAVGCLGYVLELRNERTGKP